MNLITRAEELWEIRDCARLGRVEGGGNETHRTDEQWPERYKHNDVVSRCRTGLTQEGYGSFRALHLKADNAKTRAARRLHW